MERRLTGISRSGVERYFINRAGSSKPQRVFSVGVVLDYQWIVEERDLITVGAEEEESIEFRMDVIHAKLHGVVATQYRDIVAKLKLLLFRLLRHVHICA